MQLYLFCVLPCVVKAAALPGCVKARVLSQATEDHTMVTMQHDHAA